jgi:hypothetical protein
MWYQNAQNFIPKLKAQKWNQILIKYGDLHYAPREMARGVDLQFAVGGGGGWVAFEGINLLSFM